MHELPRRQNNALEEILVRDYVFSFLALFGFLSAFYALVPTFPLFLARLGFTAGEIGVLVGTAGLASLVSRFIVGRLLTNVSERRVMMGGAMLFLLTFLALTVFRSFWPFFALRLLQGAAFALLDTATVAYVVRIIPGALRARAITYLLLAVSLASAIAGSGSVFVFNAYDFNVLLVICSGFSLCSFMLSWFLRGRVASALTSSASSTRFFEPKILAPAIASFVFFCVLGGVMAFFPLYSVACGVKNPGYFFSASAAVVIVARLTTGKVFDLCSKERIIVIFGGVSAFALLLLSLSHTLPMFIFVGALWGAGGAFVYPTLMAYALEYAGSSGGTAVATYQAFMDFGLAAGPMAAGIMLPYTGYTGLFLCLASLSLVNIGYFQFCLQRRTGRWGESV